MCAESHVRQGTLPPEESVRATVTQRNGEARCDTFLCHKTNIEFEYVHKSENRAAI